LGSLDPGSYYIDDRSVTNVSRLTLTVPAGWTTDDSGFLYKGRGGPGEVVLVTWVISHIFRDACRWDEGGLIDVGTTVAQLVTALSQQEGRQASSPRDVMLDGFTGMRIELTRPVRSRRFDVHQWQPPVQARRRSGLRQRPLLQPRR
jgi:hypothetical protein